MGEHEGGFRELADAPGAGGDVLQDTPAADEQGEAAFAEGAHRAQQLVVGAGHPQRRVDSVLSTAPPLAQVEPNLAAVINGAIIVGHNVGVDWRLCWQPST